MLGIKNPSNCGHSVDGGVLNPFIYLPVVQNTQAVFWLLTPEFVEDKIFEPYGIASQKYEVAGYLACKGTKEIHLDHKKKEGIGIFQTSILLVQKLLRKSRRQMDNFKKPIIKKGSRGRQKLVKQSFQLGFNTNTRHAPGWVYILVAQGYHGIFPGCFLKRCKIGLTQDVASRLKRLESSQAPCDYKLIKSIYVRDMADVESLLHEQFSDCNVQLKQSREWFDLPLWRLWGAYLAFAHYENHHRYGVKQTKSVALGIIAFSLLALVVVSYIIQQASKQPRPTEPIELKGQEVEQKLLIGRIEHAALFAGAAKTGQTISSNNLDLSKPAFSVRLRHPQKFNPYGVHDFVTLGKFKIYLA